MDDPPSPTRRPRSPPRRITAQSLENIALHYLERFASSSATLRRVLLRRVERAAAVHGDDVAAGAALVDALIARYLAAGLLDDRVYAAQKAASLHRRGTSRYGLRGKLAQKGLAPDLIDAAVAEVMAEQGGDLAAAAALARRRRLGPYREAVRRAEYRHKDLAAFARAGFGRDLAERVLNAEDGAALEALLREAQGSD